MRNKGRQGNNGNSIYIWSNDAKFDRYYKGENSIRDYSKLNYIYSGLTTYDLWAIQKQNLSKSVRDTEIAKNFSMFEKIVPEQKKILEQYSAAFNKENFSDKIYAEVLQILNEGLIGRHRDTVYGQYMNIVDKAKKENKSVKEIEGFDQIYNEALTMYNKLIEYKNKGYIDENAILLFNKRFGWILGGSSSGYSSSGLAKEFKKSFGNSAGDYASQKAQYAEDLVRQFFYQAPLKNIFGLVNSGGFINGSKQLIEDSFAYNKAQNGKTSFKDGVALSYTVKKISNNKISTKQANTWEEFEAQVKAIDKSKNTIILTDDAYNLLQKSKALSVQVKSHLHGPQSIINEDQERFAISLDEIQLNRKMLLSQLLTDYDKIQSIDYDKESSKLALVVNLYLSKYITKTQIANNDLYFTEAGMETAAQWMNRTHKMLAFTPAINTANKLLAKCKFKYGFVDI